MGEIRPKRCEGVGITCPVPAPTSQIVRLWEEMSQPKKSFSEVNAPCSTGHGQRTRLESVRTVKKNVWKTSLVPSRAEC